MSVERKHQLIGVTGRKRHGKDSVGSILAREGLFYRVAFADKLKTIVKDLYGLSFEQLYGTTEQKETVDPRWGKSPRQLLQLFGTNVARSVHEDTWVNYLMEQRQAAIRGESVLVLSVMGDCLVRKQFWGSVDWVVTDVRFPNEAEAIRAAGGKIVKVVRPGMDGTYDEHASETSVDLIKEDVLLINNGSLKELQQNTLRQVLGRDA